MSNILSQENVDQRKFYEVSPKVIYWYGLVCIYFILSRNVLKRVSCSNAALFFFVLFFCSVVAELLCLPFKNIHRQSFSLFGWPKRTNLTLNCEINKVFGQQKGKCFVSSFCVRTAGTNCSLCRPQAWTSVVSGGQMQDNGAATSLHKLGGTTCHCNAVQCIAVHHWESKLDCSAVCCSAEAEGRMKGTNCTLGPPGGALYRTILSSSAVQQPAQMARHVLVPSSHRVV